LNFPWIIYCQNKLKEPTNTRVKMATGDNIKIIVCVGRKSNLIDKNTIRYSCEIKTKKT